MKLNAGKCWIKKTAYSNILIFRLEMILFENDSHTLLEIVWNNVAEANSLLTPIL